jgi:hypothetical protein
MRIFFEFVLFFIVWKGKKKEKERVKKKKKKNVYKDPSKLYFTFFFLIFSLLSLFYFTFCSMYLTLPY